MLQGVNNVLNIAPDPILKMPVPRDAYTDATRLYLPEAYCFDEKSLFRDIDAAMNKLQGETLRMALRHLYIKWGDYSDEGREEFASDLLALAETRSVSTPRKPAVRRFRSPDAGNEPARQAALF
jgi:hypothetical protein